MVRAKKSVLQDVPNEAHVVAEKDVPMEARVVAEEVKKRTKRGRRHFFHYKKYL